MAKDSKPYIDYDKWTSGYGFFAVSMSRLESAGAVNSVSRIGTAHLNMRWKEPIKKSCTVIVYQVC